MQYSLRTLLEIVAAAAFVLALVIAWRARPPAPAPAAPPPGCYQVFVTEDQVLVMDTATGSLWTKDKHHSQFSRSDSPWRAGLKI